MRSFFQPLQYTQASIKSTELEHKHSEHALFDELSGLFKKNNFLTPMRMDELVLKILLSSKDPLVKCRYNAKGEVSCYFTLSQSKDITSANIRTLATVIPYLPANTVLDLTATNFDAKDAVCILDALKFYSPRGLKILIDNGYDDGFPGCPEKIYYPGIYEAFIKAIQKGEGKRWPQGMMLYMPPYEPLIHAIASGLKQGNLPEDFGLNLNHNIWYPMDVSMEAEKALMKAVMSEQCPKGVYLNPQYFNYERSLFDRTQFNLIDVINAAKGLRLDTKHLNQKHVSDVLKALECKKLAPRIVTTLDEDKVAPTCCFGLWTNVPAKTSNAAQVSSTLPALKRL